MKTVAIVGVGLIGGSFALALRRAGFPGQILGVSSPEVLAKATASGVIDAGASLEAAVPQADLVYLSQSIGRILEVIPRLQPLLRSDALVTDAGSTKAAIVAVADRSLPAGQFLGGHPLAGKELRGVEAASADLFEGRTYILTPVRDADMEASRMRDFTSWLTKMGSLTIVMNPQDHDKTLALTSHLPQVVSTALASMLNHADHRVKEAFGPALLDSTRLALSPYEIWRDILLTNHSEVEQVLEAYINTLQSMREHLNDDDLRKFFVDGAAFASQIRRK